MLERKYSDFGIRYTMAYSSGRHLNMRDDSGMFIFLKFCVGCLSSPYQKYSDVFSSCSVYTFFSEMFIENPPGGFNVNVKIHTIVIEAGGISSALNPLDPFWSRSWKFPNIASELRLDIDRCSQVQLSANAYNYNRRSTLLLCTWAEHTGAL